MPLVLLMLSVHDLLGFIFDGPSPADVVAGSSSYLPPLSPESALAHLQSDPAPAQHCLGTCRRTRIQDDGRFSPHRPIES